VAAPPASAMACHHSSQSQLTSSLAQARKFCRQAGPPPLSTLRQIAAMPAQAPRSDMSMFQTDLAWRQAAAPSKFLGNAAADCR
jgi:hypothetical protein